MNSRSPEILRQRVLGMGLLFFSLLALVTASCEPISSQDPYTDKTATAPIAVLPAPTEQIVSQEWIKSDPLCVIPAGAEYYEAQVELRFAGKKDIPLMDHKDTVVFVRSLKDPHCLGIDRDSIPDTIVRDAHNN